MPPSRTTASTGSARWSGCAFATLLIGDHLDWVPAGKGVTQPTPVQEFRASLRTSKHRVRPGHALPSQIASRGTRSVQDQRHAEDAAEEWEGAATEAAEPAPSPRRDWDSADESEGEQEPSLADMQAFLKQLQFIYRTRGSAGPLNSRAGAKLAELRVAAQAGRAAEHSDDASSASSDCEEACAASCGAGSRPATHRSAAGARAGSGSLGVVEAAGLGEALPRTTPSSAEAELLQRLAAAEVRLASFQGMEEEMRQLKRQVQAVQEENTRLSTGSRASGIHCWQCTCLLWHPCTVLTFTLTAAAAAAASAAADLSDFVTHTSTLLSSLQLQLVRSMAAGPPAAAMAALPTDAASMPVGQAVWAVHAVDVQAAAAVQAMHVAQKCSTAVPCCGTAPGLQRAQAADAPTADALDDIQLASFSQRFGSAAGRGGAGPAGSSLGHAAKAGACEDPENAPPQPRQLPRVLVASPGPNGATPPSHHTPGGNGGFQWQPYNSSSST